MTQIGSITIQKGNLNDLMAALKTLGLNDRDASELQSAIGEDTGGGATPNLGQRTAAWLGRVGSKLGDAGTDMAAEVAKAEATRWVLQFLGLS